MLVIFYLLLMLRVGRSTDKQNFETETVGFGQSVTLNCTRQKSSESTELFWIRIVSGNLPEVLGATYTFDYDGVNETPRITAKQEPGAFILHISKTQPSDTGLYYCIKVVVLHMTFLKGTFLKIKGPEPDITAVIQVPPSDRVGPGDSVTLQCSVLSDSDKKTCPGEHSVYWFRAGSDESHPTLIYAHGNSADECERSAEAQSQQSCVYNFSKTISSSDAGTFYCAVATCGEILFGKGTKLDIKVSEVNMWDLQKTNTVLLLLCAALALTVIAFAVWIYTIKNKSSAGSLQRDGGGQKSQQRDKDMQVYSAVIFTMMKPDSGALKDAKAADRIYAAVEAFGSDY